MTAPGRTCRAAALGIAVAASLAGCSQTRRTARYDEPRRPEPSEAREVPPDRTRPPVPASPEGLLKPGGARRIQEALAKRGYLRAPRGDTLDDATAAALRRFQQEEGLAATGFPDRETLRQLRIDPAEIYRSTDDGSAGAKR